MSSGIDILPRRRLGRSPVTVSEIGFGGGPVGNLRRAITDAEAGEVLAAAWAGGIRSFDTAPLYGHGQSERRLGAYLRGRPRDEFAISTKVGRRLRPTSRDDFDHHGFVDIPQVETVFDYSREGARASLEESLERLRLDRLDVVLIHDIDHWTHGADQPRAFAAALDGAYRALADFRAAGTVGAIGIGVNEWQVCQDFALRAPIDCVLLAGRYTLLEQEPGQEFLPFCVERGIGVVVGGPFNSGILATGAVAGAWYNYAPAPPEVMDRVRRIQAVVARHGVSVASAALAFPLRHPAVASVIPGMMTPAEVANAVASARTPVPPALWDELRNEGLIIA
jgi:D-threo-aldose 1-dehydrogenase